MTGLIESFRAGSYRSIAQQPLGKTIGFLFVVILIISALISLKITVTINRFLSEVNIIAERNLGEMVKDIPAIEIKDGQLIAPNQRFVKSWQIPNQGNFTLAIEPDGQAAAGLMQDHPFAVVLTRNRVYFKTTERGSVAKIQEQKLDNVAQAKITAIANGLRAEFPNAAFELTPATVAAIIAKVKFFVWPVMFVIMLGIYSFTKPLQVLFFSLIGLIISASTRAGLSYRQLFSISAYSLVPASALGVLAEFLGLGQRAPFLVVTIYWAVLVAYISLGIKNSRADAV
jgi:hypothetical protein